MGNLELTAGLGFGRLAGRNSFSNPLGTLSTRFDKRDGNFVGKGGTLGTINWFQGNASAFYGIQYHISDNITISSEFTPDLMSPESSYLDVKSPWNVGASYQLNDYVNLSAQYLYGSQVSITHVSVNQATSSWVVKNRPCSNAVKVWRRPTQNINAEAIRKVLAVDELKSII